MSTAPSPSSDTEPSDATDWSVMRGCCSLLTSIVTSTLSPTKSSLVTEPTSTPATRTGAPSFNPAMLANTVLIE